MKLVLTAHVHVRDEDGTAHVFGPGNEVPTWAKARITNPAAWGYPMPRTPGRVTDFGGEVVDVTCSQGHALRVVARFETADVLGDDTWDWRWTSSFVGTDTGADGHPVAPTRGVWDGERWHFAPTGEDRGRRHAIAYAPDGRRLVRLRCCRFDLPLRWEKAQQALNRLHAAGVSSVEADVLRPRLGSGRVARLTWDEREQLILEAIRDLEDDDPDLQNGVIEQATGLSEKDVGLGLQALIDDDYIAGSDGQTFAEAVGAYVVGARLAPKARRHLRQWPNPEDARDALLQVLDDALERTEDPEEQTALEQAKRGIRSLTGKVITELSVALIKRASGLEG